MEKFEINHEKITQTILKHVQAETYLLSPRCFAKIGMPKNFVSGNDYSGGNLLVLASRRFVSPWFLTFLQAKELGGNIKKGEKGIGVIKFGVRDKEAKEDALIENLNGFIKRYTVFNSSQIEGIEFPDIAPPSPENLEKRLDLPEALISRITDCPEIHEGRKAVPSYFPGIDTIEMPGREFFSELSFYYMTLFHELTHSTGHKSRLARQTLKDATARKRKPVAYVKEELVAELGAAFLSDRAGLVDDDHRESAGYMAGWLKSVQAIPDSEQWIDEAAEEAEKAVQFLLGGAE